MSDYPEIDFFEAIDAWAVPLQKDAAHDSDEAGAESEDIGPAFLTPHAYARFCERVAPVSHAEAVRVMRRLLERGRRVIEEDRDEVIYTGSYRGHPVYLALGEGEDDKPAVVSVYGRESVVHGRVCRGEAVIRHRPLAETPRHTCRRASLIGALAPYWERYTDEAYQRAMQPLRVMVHLAGPMGGYHRPTLDGLLARIVVDEALQGNALDDTYAPYLLPVPLYLLWRHPESGLPLWACNDFAPAGPNKRITEYWHKRIIRPEHARPQKGQPQPYSIKGRYKEKRVPMPAQTAAVWWADAIGDPAEVLRLMQLVQAMGKRRMALVTAVSVEPIERFAMTRPVPLDYLDDPERATHRAVQGWTPPYWPGVPECHAECGLPV